MKLLSKHTHSYEPAVACCGGGVVAVWCGVMLWCGGVVWGCDVVVWCGVVWCGVVWCGAVWCGWLDGVRASWCGVEVEVTRSNNLG